MEYSIRTLFKVSLTRWWNHDFVYCWHTRCRMRSVISLWRRRAHGSLPRTNFAANASWLFHLGFFHRMETTRRGENLWEREYRFFRFARGIVKNEEWNLRRMDGFISILFFFLSWIIVYFYFGIRQIHR